MKMYWLVSPGYPEGLLTVGSGGLSLILASSQADAMTLINKFNPERWEVTGSLFNSIVSGVG